MFPNPSRQALLPGAGPGDVLLPSLYCGENGDFLDESYFNGPVFAEAQSHAATPCPVFKPEDQLFPQPGAIHWIGGSGPELSQSLLAMDTYHHNLAAVSWNNSQAAAGAGLDDYSAWLPADYFQGQNQSTVPVPPFNSGYAGTSSDWAAGTPFSPTGSLAPAVSLAMPSAIQYPDADGIRGSKMPCHGAQPLQSQAKGWLAEPADSCVLPQAIYQNPPPDHVPSVASSPSLGDLSSAASLADVSDISDVLMSPCSLSASEASPPARSTASGRASKTRRSASTTSKGKGRTTRSNKRLPSVALTESPSISDGSPRTSRKDQRSPGVQKGASSSPHPGISWAESPAGAPYQRIQDMDLASRAVLDHTLLNDRAGGGRVPYKAIMAKVKHLFCGAEETLRGHYRRLTKKPEERVRKPVWKAIDLELLRQAVEVYRNRTNGKVSWTRVSEYINTHGGSYKFGITTCSKKWEAIKGR